MCVIIDKPCGVILSDYKVEAACEFNQDGFGYMYIDPVTNDMVAERVLCKTIAEAQKLLVAKFDELKNVHAIFHLRYGTHGSETIENVHPFQILNKKEHGRDLWFMHNGMISITSDAPEDKDKSDTAIFCEYILKPTLSLAPDLLFTHAFIGLLEEYIGSSKLLFMDDLGRVTRVGAWETNEECIVSNNNYFYSNYRTRATRQPPACGYGTYQGGYYDNYDMIDKDDKAPFTGGNSLKTETKKELDKTAEDYQKRLDEWREGNGAKQSLITLDGNKAAEETKKQLELAEAKLDRPGDDEDFDDMVMVLNTMKRVEDLTVEDLMVMYTDDIDLLVEEYPDRAQELIHELINLKHVESYQYAGGYGH